MSVQSFPPHFPYRKTVAIFIGMTFAIASCEAPHDAVIDPIYQPPAIASASVSPAIINTDSMNVGPIRLPEDVLTITLVSSATIDLYTGSVVSYTIFTDRRLDPLAQGVLRNDGAPPDTSPSDSVFAGEVQFQVHRSFVGVLMVELVAQNNKGLTGASFLQSIAIQRLNQAPVLSNLQAPDTVQPSVQQSFVVTVQGADPDGIADIVSVTRQTPANNIFNLNDSGVNGDLVAGDGIFTETVSINPPPPSGSYPFQFKALDRSNVQSNIIFHTVVVIP